MLWITQDGEQRQRRDFSGHLPDTDIVNIMVNKSTCTDFQKIKFKLKCI
jgi:hypothetical protein